MKKRNHDLLGGNKHMPQDCKILCAKVYKTDPNNPRFFSVICDRDLSPHTFTRAYYDSIAEIWWGHSKSGVIIWAGACPEV